MEKYFTIEKINFIVSSSLTLWNYVLLRMLKKKPTNYIINPKAFLYIPFSTKIYDKKNSLVHWSDSKPSRSHRNELQLWFNDFIELFYSLIYGLSDLTDRNSLDLKQSQTPLNYNINSFLRINYL